MTNKRPDAAENNSFDFIWPKLSKAINISEADAKLIFCLGFAHGCAYASACDLDVVRQLGKSDEPRR